MFGVAQLLSSLSHNHSIVLSADEYLDSGPANRQTVRPQVRMQTKV